MEPTYQNVLDYYDENYAKFGTVLDSVEKLVTSGRDQRGIPIYLTKQRIKTPDSIYLKTKRGLCKGLSDVRDCAGVRVLCLFEQDIFEAHKYLVEVLSQKGLQFIEAEIYNWKDDYAYGLLEKELVNVLPPQRIKRTSKRSGYKSIHYDIEYSILGQKVPVEIQLRTLLQDVWGELEHALSYKQGSIHPHIRESFRLLAQDLETNDSLMRHLKGVSDKERCCAAFGLKQSGSPFYFGTEMEAVPGVFLAGRLKESYDQYREYIGRRPKAREELSAWVTEARRRYKEITNELSGMEFADGKTKYWVEMERAYFDLLEGNMDSALAIYKNVEGGEGANKYILHFRIGEVCFKQGEIVNALVEFDKAEDLLGEQANADYLNVYRVKTKLANIYWLLGQEYYDIAVRQINEAHQIYESHSEFFDDAARCRLFNNLCWYTLEKFLLAQETGSDKEKIEQYYDEALEAFRKLEGLLPQVTSSNGYDTAAWFCYHTYRKTGNENQLQRAKKYCERVWNKENRSTFALMSVNIQRNHLAEIMSPK